MLEEKIITYCKELQNGVKGKKLPYHNVDLINRRNLFLDKLVLKHKELELLRSVIWINVTAMAVEPLSYKKRIPIILSELGDVVTEELKDIFKSYLESKEDSLLSHFNRAFNYSYEAKKNLNQIRLEQIELLGNSFLDGTWLEEQERELVLLEKNDFKLEETEMEQQTIAKSIISSKRKKYEKALETEIGKELFLDNNEVKRLRKKLVKIQGIPERGIESWFRLASKNLYVRLKIVDTKAGILITSNSLIISIVLGSLYTHLDEDPHLIYAVGALIITCTLSLIFAIIAAIPKLKSSSKDVETDLMTFEYFHHLSLQQYREGLQEIMGSGEILYDSITTDIYQLGQKLIRKYRLINISFSILLYGVIMAVLMFGVCHLIGI